MGRSKGTRGLSWSRNAMASFGRKRLGSTKINQQIKVPTQVQVQTWVSADLVGGVETMSGDASFGSTLHERNFNEEDNAM